LDYFLISDIELAVDPRQPGISTGSYGYRDYVSAFTKLMPVVDNAIFWLTSTA